MQLANATPAFEQNRTVHHKSRSAEVGPHLVLSLTAATAPWLYAALTRIHAVEGLDERVAGVGHFQVSKAAAHSARRAILALGRKDLPAPAVTVVSGDALGLIWGIGNRRIELTAYPDDEVTYATFLSGNLQATGNVIDEDDSGQIVCRRSELLQSFRWLMGE